MLTIDSCIYKLNLVHSFNEEPISNGKMLKSSHWFSKINYINHNLILKQVKEQNTCAPIPTETALPQLQPTFPPPSSPPDGLPTHTIRSPSSPSHLITRSSMPSPQPTSDQRFHSTRFYTARQGTVRPAFVWKRFCSFILMLRTP